MAYSEYWGNIVFHRLDRITNMSIADETAKPLRTVPGYEAGINYRELSSAMPYMYTDRPERIEFLADISIIDHIIDWFGREVEITKDTDEAKVRVSLKASPNAMEHWALQYLSHVEITAPESLRERVKKALIDGVGKYRD